LLERINKTFLEDLDGRHFVTVYYAVFEKEQGCLTYCSAGHIPQFLLHPGPKDKVWCLTEMPSHGLVLGMFPDVQLNETRVDVGDYSRLVLYTDGISEAHGATGMFGFERLRELALEGAKESAERLGYMIMESLSDFRKSAAAFQTDPGEDLSDDATLVILDL
jgi:serine phosphatase RsbU (regulator of sigma subunit)